MANTLSPEQRELQLVQNVDFKILGVANKESKLHDLLQRYLTPLLLKAASEHGSVRSEVIKIVARLKTFIQPPSIVLPVSALLDQYKASGSALVKQLDVSFIQHSLERIDDHDRRLLIPKALPGVSHDAGQPRAKAFWNVVARLLLDLRIPPRGSKEDASFRTDVGLSDQEDAQYVADMIGILLRLKAPSGDQSWVQANATLGQMDLACIDLETPDGLKILQKLSELKTKLITFLSSAAFTDDERFLAAIYGAAGYDGRVSSIAEEILKRSSTSLEDATLAERLFQVHNRLGVPYRVRILNLLSKSAVSANMQDPIIQAVDLNLQIAYDQDGSSSQQSSRLERTKLFKALFQYLTWVARMNTSGNDFKIGPALIDNMRNFINYQGWPQPKSPLSQDETTIRSQVYESIGLLGRTASNMAMDERIQLGSFLFESLSQDPTAEAVVNIDGALSILATRISIEHGQPEQKQLLYDLLFSNVNRDGLASERTVRHAVVKWANQCLPFNDVKARWIDIVAVAGGVNERNDVVEQGNKGLDPWTYRDHGSHARSALPSWQEMIQAYFMTSIEKGSYLSSHMDVDEDQAEQTVFRNFHQTSLRAFALAVRYIKQMLFLSALQDFPIEPGWEESLTTSISRDLQSRHTVKEYLRSSETQPIINLLTACLEGALKKDSPIIEDCLRTFSDVASLCPLNVISSLTTYTRRLLPLIHSNAKDIRDLAAKALGILAPHPANEQSTVDEWCQSLLQSLQNTAGLFGSQLNEAEGSLLALGHICSRALYYEREPPLDMTPYLSLLDQDSRQPSLLDTATDTFSQLWSAGFAVPALEAGSWNVNTVIDHLTVRAKKGNDKAITALGRLALGLDQTSRDISSEKESTEAVAGGVVGDVLEHLLALHDLKQVEVHLTIGDAITAAIGRWDSDLVKLTVDVDNAGKVPELGSRPEVVGKVLERLFKGCKSTKPALLKASGIWLFCIVQYCSNLPEVQSSLRQAQAAFMPLLTARDDLVQETASRGLSLVYERGDEDLKATLVKDLVSAFTGSGPQLKVEEDTELFEAGALPTGEGKSVTSYKDILNLANEVGDQGLVYKFMSLAANAATWSTRSAFGRFGLSNILSDSEVDPKLYPKLFRYRFDPNSNVQRSMDGIWKALVKDTGKVLDENFDAIMDDLLKNILGREWRVRQASCAAIADLLQSRPFAQYEQYYRDIWTNALKVLDDVKGSVREEAEKLCRTLSNSLVRQLEQGDGGSAAKAMMKEALPFLLSDKGVESSVQDVQAFSTLTVIKITKEAGSALKPFVPEMVPQLLGLLSSIEPQQINYYYQRVGEDSREQLDKIRSQMVGQSPISEAIENCLRCIDKDVMAELAPRLESTIKTAIGFSTKIGCCRVIQALCTRHMEDVKPVASSLLKLCEKQALDKNDEVSRAYAAAVAYLIRHVSQSTKLKICKRLTETYLSSEGESRRQKIGDMVMTMGKVSPDHFTSQEVMLLPLSYLGSHDTDEYTSKIFGEAWESHAGSSRTVVRYVSEISALVSRCLDTQQWALRHTAAFTVAAMVSDVASASEATGEMGLTNLQTIWPLLDKTLALKTFPGKEKLLDSFAKFVDKGRDLWLGDADVAKQMTKITIREAKRNNDDYRIHAFQTLWKYAKARDDINVLGDVVDVVKSHLDALKDEDKMEVDSEAPAKEDLVMKTAKTGVEAVARGFPRSRLPSVLADVLEFLVPYLQDSKFLIIKREVWYSCVEDMMKEAVDAMGSIKEKSSADFQPAELGRAYIQSLDLDLSDTGLETQRIKRASAVAAVLKMVKDYGSQDGLSGMDDVRSKAEVARKEERSLDVQKAWDTVLAYWE